MRFETRRSLYLEAQKSRYLRIPQQEIFEESMEKEEILRTLTRCGLNEYESRVYASLVFLGPSKAATISRDSRVPQSKIYDVLEELTEKQLVEVFNGRPKEFKAVTPDVALKNLLEEKVKELDALKARVEVVSSYMKSAAAAEVTNGVWIVRGKKWMEFFNKAVEMLDRSKRYVYGVTRDYSRSAKLAEAVRRCLRRGVKIRVIGMEPVTADNYYKAKWYKAQGIALRVFETKVHPRIVLVDGKEVLLRLDHNPNKKERFRFNSLWSEDPSLVKVMDAYVKNLWKSAKPVNFRKIPVPNF